MGTARAKKTPSRKVNTDPIDDILRRLSKKERKSIMSRMVKLQEECGELAVAILQDHGLKGFRKSFAAVHDNILEEGADVIIMVLSVLGAYSFTRKDIFHRITSKLKKWERQIRKK